MQTRYKTFSEFIHSTRIAYKQSSGANGVLIVCKAHLNSQVLFENKFKPWNSEATRRIFLIKLYIKNILLAINVSKHIRRMAGYELLGKRCLYRDHVSVICDAWEVVNQETGEVSKKLSISNELYNHPLDLLITEVQL